MLSGCDLAGDVSVQTYWWTALRQSWCRARVGCVACGLMRALGQVGYVRMTDILVRLMWCSACRLLL